MKVLWNSIIYNLSYILEMEAEYNFLAKFLVKTLLIPMRGGGVGLIPEESFGIWKDHIVVEIYL